jgi:hypothetical protein
MLDVPVVLLVAAAAVLVGVVAVALGHGGELAYFSADYAPLELEQVTSTDVGLFRPPTALWGYSMQATDEALSRIASAITERDIEISALQQQVADLQASSARRRPAAKPERAGRPAQVPGNGESLGPADVLDNSPAPRDPSSAPSWLPRAGRPAAPPSRPAPQPPRPEDKDQPSRPPWERPGQGDTPSSTDWAALPPRHAAADPPTPAEDEQDGR